MGSNTHASGLLPRACLVTGGAKRVGREIALHLAEAGWDIALHFHSSQAEAEATRAEIRARGRTCEIFAADLANGAALPELVSRAKQAFPGLCGLVNNASRFVRAPLLEADERSFDTHMAVNLKAPVLLTQAFVRQVKKGAVVNLLDSKIHTAKHSYFHYMLSKKALAEFTRMAAAELGPHVRVNAVCPGVVMDSSDGEFTDDYIASETKRVPLKRTATPQEVARAVEYLLSNEALTGQFLYVDGGGSLA